MAKKRRKHHKGRRRVSGLGLKGGQGLKLLSVAAGYLMADTVNAQIDKTNIFQSTNAATNVKEPNQTMYAVSQVGIGGLLMMKKIGSGTVAKVLPLAGGVLAGAGMKRALKKLGVIKGYQSVPVIGRHRLAGYQSVPVIGGPVPAQLAGKVIPGQLQGYVSQGSGVGSYIPQGSGVGAARGSQIMPNANGSGLMSSSGYMG